MILIVEGPDGSGKSTFVNRLREEISTPLTIVRSSRPPKRQEDIFRVVTWLSRFPWSYNTLVLDRFVGISEPIYGRLLRGESKYPEALGLPSLFPIDKIQVIYCRPPFSTILEYAKNQPQMAGVLENMALLVDAYDKEMVRIQETGVQVRWYDRTLPEGTHIWAQLNQLIQEKDRD